VSSQHAATKRIGLAATTKGHSTSACTVLRLCCSNGCPSCSSLAWVVASVGRACPRRGKLKSRDSSRCDSLRQRLGSGVRQRVLVRFQSRGMGACGGLTEPAAASTTTAEQVFVGVSSCLLLSRNSGRCGSQRQWRWRRWYCRCRCHEGEGAGQPAAGGRRL